MNASLFDPIRQMLLAQGILSGFLAVLLWALARRERAEPFYRYWVIGWTAHAVSLVAAAAAVQLMVVYGPLGATSVPVRDLLRLTAGVAAGVHAAYLISGVRRLGPAPRSRWQHPALVTAFVGIMVFATMVSSRLDSAMLGSSVRSLARQSLELLAYTWCAVAFWMARDRLGRSAPLILVASMAGWAAEQALFAMSSVRSVASVLGNGLEWLPSITSELGSRLAFFDFLWLSSLVAGLILTVLTASDRDRAELARTTRAYQTLIGSSPSAILVVGTSGLVQLANPAAEQLFGWAPGKAPTMPPVPLGAAGESPWRSALAGQKIVRLVGDVVRTDGTMAVVSLAVAPVLGADGTVEGAIGVATDLTGQRRLEADLRHAQKMEAVGRLAGGIAHDFNNLLTAILGSLHLLEDDLAKDHPAAETVDEIREAANRAADLTSRLLSFSRRERRAPVPLDLDALLADFRKLLRRVVDEHVDMAWELAGGLPLVIGDRGELEQVVTNLCVNARDAMQEAGGTIVVRTALFETPFPISGVLPAPEAGRYVRLDVADTGAGMDEATLNRMFEPFYTTKYPGKGTGLGLATVYAIVEEMGGQLRVESTPGSGTLFSLFLRAA